MTNVKLKLMFFVLNGLLTADFVISRPHNFHNSTDLIINFSSNGTYEKGDSFNIPVDSNADTLIVANEDDGLINLSDSDSKTEMESIVNAEQNRDEDFSKKVIKDQGGPSNTSKNNADSLNKPLKLSNPVSLINVSKEDARINLMNSESKTEMESIVNAEQNRDEDFSKKVIKDQSGTLNISKNDADALNKQLKVSSPALEGIIDAETGREESMTDILFKSEAELEEIPRFEFLIAIKPNNTDVLVNVNRSVNLRGLAEVLNENSGKIRNDSEILKKVDYVELVEVVKQNSENKSEYNLGNITGHDVENDNAPDTILSVFAGFTDVQTLFLACFGTLLPLLAILCVTLLVRCICRRWCRRRAPSSVSESSEHKHANHQLKSSTEEHSGGTGSADGNAGPANGSIITMTLKNNHLIVETEERNDITKNGRETKMKYSPDNDGIFVVEVQQSTAYKPNNNKSLQNSPPHDPQISTNQAQIHRVPEELDKEENDSNTENSNPDQTSEIDSVKIDKNKLLALSSTGLSISDLSMSSVGSHNISYSYGSQVGYELGPFGYPVYAGYDIPKEHITEGITYDSSREPLISKTPTDPDKPVVTSAILKQDSIIGNNILKGPGYCIEGSSDGPLLSDVLAREVSLQQLHDKMEKDNENEATEPIEKIESPKQPLNRADSLPVRLEDEIPAQVNENNTMETITEEDLSTIRNETLKGKRASLPIIRTEMYESVKDTLMPTGSPKFEKFNNDPSPGENTANVPPLITITEENDTMKTEEVVS